MSVDEQIVPFKGRHSLKVYVEKKPNKWGYKIWGSAGASGYMHKFYIQGDNLVEGEPDLDEGIGKSGEVVLNLCRHLPVGTHIYFDNYFASPDLLLELKKRGFNATCTVRANRRRKCPTLTKNQFKKKGRGTYDYRSADGVLLCAWYDNRIENVASNKCSVAPTVEVRRYNKATKEYMYVECPALIKAYNKCMGGVDKCDMMLSFYRIKMKSRKWYRRLIFHMVDLAISNAWHLQKAVTGISSRYYRFKLAIAECLVNGAVQPEPRRREEMPIIPQDVRSAKVVPNHVRYDGYHHLPKQVAKIPKKCKL
ncbi:piggyBac transposable element-derived protein 3-like [Lineus longissimus]|uniref:piggyBac transposable element-derived protein 3-like n=1 Tax=Lineus longissimus TaxID=88925 RepID=UPI00315CD33F